MSNSIPLRYRIRSRHKGAIPQPRDFRDIVLGDIDFVHDPKCPSWEKGFDNEVKYGRLKRNHQGSSLSCVGQGWSKHAEMLDKIEKANGTRLSARYIYSQIYRPNGGAYIRDGGGIVVNQGVGKESAVPSYDNGNPPNEAFMRRNDGVDAAREGAKTFKSLKYVWIEASKVNDDMRQIIWQKGGFTSGYNGHCEFFTRFGMKNGKKGMWSIGSFGEPSDRWVDESSPHRIYDATFLIDLPNPPEKINMLKIIGDKAVTLCESSRLENWLLLFMIPMK